MLAAGLTGGPGGCRGKEECEAYCEDLSHLEECVDFAEKMGFISPEDAARARKMAQMGVNIMGGGPGGCKSEGECRAFCEDPANMEEYLNFAVQIGEMTPEQAEQARKGMEMMKRGGPGGCKSEEECKIYCEDPAHAEECINFAVEIGEMSPEEAQRIREMMQGPPPRIPPEGAPPEGMVPPEEMMPEGMPPEGMPLEGIPQPPYPEEIERIKQQEMKRAMEKARKMMPESIPPKYMPPEEFTPSPPPEIPFIEGP